MKKMPSYLFSELPRNIQPLALTKLRENPFWQNFMDDVLSRTVMRLMEEQHLSSACVSVSLKRKNKEKPEQKVCLAFEFLFDNRDKLCEIVPTILDASERNEFPGVSPADFSSIRVKGKDAVSSVEMHSSLDRRTAKRFKQAIVDHFNGYMSITRQILEKTATSMMFPENLEKLLPQDSLRFDASGELLVSD